MPPCRAGTLPPLPLLAALLARGRPGRWGGAMAAGTAWRASQRPFGRPLCAHTACLGGWGTLGAVWLARAPSGSRSGAERGARRKVAILRQEHPSLTLSPLRTHSTCITTMLNNKAFQFALLMGALSAPAVSAQVRLARDPAREERETLAGDLFFAAALPPLRAPRAASPAAVRLRAHRVCTDNAARFFC